MKYILLLVLALGLAACDPEDAVNIEVNPPAAVQDAVDSVQQGADQLNDAVQNIGEGGEAGEGNGESAGEEN